MLFWVLQNIVWSFLAATTSLSLRTSFSCKILEHNVESDPNSNCLCTHNSLKIKMLLMISTGGICFSTWEYSSLRTNLEQNASFYRKAAIWETFSCKNNRKEHLLKGSAAKMILIHSLGSMQIQINYHLHEPFVILTAEQVASLPLVDRWH